MNEQRSSAETPFSVVTGAFGFSGQHIARALLARGEKVRTLTNHPDRGSALYRQVEVAALEFRNIPALTLAMAGASVLYNTYWVRFAHGQVNHATAVKNIKSLIAAAEAAGVRRIVHVSITNPSLQSPLSYFRGKAEVEEAIRESSLSYAILRPAVLFGEGGILINNIAWLLRRFPLFAIPGDGQYRIQPIFVDDLAELALEYGRQQDNVVVDAVGPEAYTYQQLVELIRSIVGSRSRIVHLPPRLVRIAAWTLGALVHDVVLTDEEIRGLMADLLVSSRPPTGHTSLRGWMETHRQTLGTGYASELGRHYR